MNASTGDVIGELVRALADLLLLPLRAVSYLLERKQREREARGDLLCDSRFSALPGPGVQTKTRALVIFISCAEASGELHAANLVDAMREQERERGAPEPRFLGLGGSILASRGVEIIGDPVSRAAMGFDVFSNLPFYLSLLKATAQRMRLDSPDLFLPVDSPALHVPLCHMAKRLRIPVVHFVTPQYWGWAPWRAKGYRRAVDLALCILPFELPWFERHRIRVAHVGHPLLDELVDTPASRTVAAPAAQTVIALLPGSRRHVLKRNLPWMLSVLDRLHQRDPELRVIIPQRDPGLLPEITGCIEKAGAEEWASIANGDLHHELGRVQAAFSVSGTVLIDLLHHRLPTVVIYLLANARQSRLYRHFLTPPYFASVNLLAGREVLPEFCFHVGDSAEPLEEVGRALERCYADENWRAQCLEGMQLAAERLGPPGAISRAARHALAHATGSGASSHA